MEKDKSFGGTSKVQILAEKLRENKDSLHISRVPKKTRDMFIEIADEEFCSDYGMFLKFLMDKAIDYDMKAMMIKVQEHEERINALEEDKNQKPSITEIKTFGGKIIKKEDKK